MLRSLSATTKGPVSVSSRTAARQQSIRSRPVASMAQRDSQEEAVTSSSNSNVKNALLAAAPLAVLASASAASAAPEVLSNLAEVTLSGEQAGIIRMILSPFFSIVSLLMIVRIVMTWYPEIDGKQFPWSLAYNPTEPLLGGTRKVIPPLSGVDISPIVWVGIISFFSETVCGPQGILSLIQREGGVTF